MSHFWDFLVFWPLFGLKHWVWGSHLVTSNVTMPKLTFRRKFHWNIPYFWTFLSFQFEKKNHSFFHRMCILFLLDNQVFFILSTIKWSKFWRKVFLYLYKYSYEANMWIFSWNSKHTNSFWKEKGKRRKMKQSMSSSCPFSWFSFKFS